MKKEIKLYCFPSAGGTAQIYHGWFNFVDEAIELVPMEYSGRGRRFPQPLLTDLADVVDDLYSMMQPDVDRMPYMMFGHSMGSLIAYELTKKLMQQGKRMPLHLFFSGRSSPNRPATKKRHHLADDELKEEIVQFGGTPPELLNDPEFSRMFLPIIRADMKAVETYTPDEEIIPLSCNISICNGKQDHLVAHLEEWRAYTSEEIEFRLFEGGHFYIRDCAKEVVEAVNHKALQYLTAMRRRK
ncbi:thioesterase II family protein [Paenibacillus humicola]|uniref:thioesterase II family protein n=1 Tax=Paenibacillus humicola TaxID=3110540 RepID=UPI00237C5089|nr:alpha/beta fold hydrolase [Paenibacillus humicola]